MKLRETWKHILSKQYKNRVGEQREKKREKGERGRLLVGGSDSKPGYSYDLQCKELNILHHELLHLPWQTSSYLVQRSQAQCLRRPLEGAQEALNSATEAVANLWQQGYHHISCCCRER